MTLTDYLREHGLTHAEFAAQIGATQAAVTRYANGRRKPSLAKIIRIESVTDGAVRAIDFAPPAEGFGAVRPTPSNPEVAA
ncbi:helix-turn-helix domain-containing protein [Methylorubrum salsuginis]|uniref:Helix-turn-helix n=1 Tax=Methylorubrum salsuginis TaxID=414703 RepID=A0A1I4FKA5_9HYPH|nr:helix-turn-helix transcriptional regulator [Methylorubrum salsuginis]SFL17903.1 Helix-turn-helix [Methylorubrum salsuginis]